MRIALDTNVLAYAEGVNGAVMRDKAMKLIQRLPPGAIVLPVQTLGELFSVLVRKAKRRPGRARAAVLSWRDAYMVVETSPAVIVNATDLASDHGLSIWDSVVLAASAEAECRLLLSEDRFTPYWRHCSRPSKSEPHACGTRSLGSRRRVGSPEAVTRRWKRRTTAANVAGVTKCQAPGS
ncbi:MAG: PIN domain-containing protein [Acidobacteria bacterium]|nr:PIN domain-containing protein [Acidobacteriota bacterium]